MSFMHRLASEAAYVRGLVRSLRRVAPITKDKTRTLRELAEDLAERFAERIALISDPETFTYAEWNGRANRYARWAVSQGIGKGDVVALLMPNRPEYLSVWLGIAKVGGVTALINTHLVNLSLAHCINCVGAKIVIVDAALLGPLGSVDGLIDKNVAIFVHGEGSQYPRIDTALAGFSDENLAPAERVPLHCNDKCLYIYTSGTTGLPKAANINHYRVQLAILGFCGVTGATASDRMYDSLPMYHTAGGVAAPGAVLAAGGTCVIREKFSAHEFWADIVHHQCTMFAYIGEMCRYLVNTPPSPNDRAHRVRLCFGNGLRPDVWVAFRDRFQLPHILEFYAATESNITLFNFDSKPGAVGRIPAWAKRKFVVAIVKFDVETETLVRDLDGLCIECGPDEVGEAVGKIEDDPSKPAGRFEGYADKAASDTKIARDVRQPGDAWFRSGDLMRRDAQGYFYFVDRIGDTFRWKGENVSTSEVSEIITAFEEVLEANVYGVRVPGAEGRVGMAAIVPRDPENFDLAGLHAHLGLHLPAYAQPKFLRLQRHMQTTGTFKQRKIELVAEGFDPSRCTDPLFFGDAAAKTFVPIDALLHERIVSGAIQL